jgi:tetratricopeptide (TPR) repeat protein
MEISLAQKAIALALAGSWQEASEINLKILQDNPNDTDALNRLAKAYFELGLNSKAKASAERAIKLDPGNAIAQKCLEKLRSAKNSTKGHALGVAPDSFLEESGKTKLVALLHPGEGSLLSALDPGEEVKIDSHAHRVTIVTEDNKYLGRLPDDLSARLRNLIKSGNKYQVLVKSADPKEVVVFIREVERGKNVSSILSFPIEKIDYVSFTPPELVHKDTPEIEETEED